MSHGPGDAEAAPPRVTASVPVGVPPLWAVLQRRLFDALDEAWRAFAGRYCAPDGSLRYEGPSASRDGADDFYEAFFNWPTLYQLGGADDLLDAAKHHWLGVTAQLTERGYVVDEFERGYDWFHLGESMLLFYGICAADPGDEHFEARAHRFAELYLPSSPTGNYDPEAAVIRAPHNGAGGPRYGINEEWASYGTGLASMRPYGLPLRDLPGISSWADLADPANAARMGAAMRERIGRGDAVVNLAATSLATNAWLYGHDDRYRDWALGYVAAWRRRAEECGGVLPDNVGPSGRVGELHGGRWYGGNYGWTWPHGLYSVGNAAVIAAVNSVLLTGRTDGLDIGRGPLDLVARQAVTGAVTDTEMSISDRWHAELGEDAARPTLLVPNRYADGGWFDYQPPQLALPVWLWHAGAAAEDAERIERLRAAGGYDWRTVRGFRNKEEAGHEAPWLAYLRGENPDYPTAVLGVALAQVERRMALIAADTTTPGSLDIHHWQRHNPVLTEALLHLTTGTPQVLYNGGLLPLRLAYEDARRGRPGLPADIAALVDDIGPDRTCVQLVHTGLTGTRRVVVRAGSFGEHRIETVRLDTLRAGAAGPGYPGDPRAYTAPETAAGTRELPVGGPRLEVELPPGRRVRLELRLTPRAYPAAHHRPARPAP
ncbi:hypothetical protein [Streptomyces sp. MP131-18]|uniref:hypothetical protein n=1 Tax=Streptomyces sp. MP131-18 TaxID=1857892 RepID=UPI00097BF770|nr:hypothetical protein [Streptomyces sp. MP131-18]ONK09663.1 hypothetical protein STBA_03640 [Streptomyces sp. MP131-18]